ncbi:MAG: sensor histidine kinase [Sphaerochaetaceae bacterium]|nr:sensor histidine kinase [Sphaerochaetaceae bacterium]
MRRYFYKLLLSFLLIGVLPLLILGPISYTITKRILVQKTRTESVQFARHATNQMEEFIREFVSISDAIIHDTAFSSLFEGSMETLNESSAEIYDNLYLLFTGMSIKPDIHVISPDGKVLVNTVRTPQEYYIERYRNWGVLRKALKAEGNPVIYYHENDDATGRFFTLAQTKLDENGSLAGIVLIDVYEDQIRFLINNSFESANHNLAMLDEFLIEKRDLYGDIPDTVAFTLVKDTKNNSTSEPPLGIVNDFYIFSLVKSSIFPFYILEYSQLVQINSITHLVAVIIIALTSVMTIICLIFAFSVSKGASKPLNEVVQCLERVSEGDFSARTVTNRKDEFGDLAKSVNAMTKKMKHLIDVSTKKEQSLRTSELKALQAQTNPHFIFNCLETIKWYILLGQIEDASQTVVELGALLRGTLDLGKGAVTIKGEFDIIQKYLALQKRRLGARLKTDIHIDPSVENIMIPRFLIQPLVENAIMYGIEKKPGGGFLDLSVVKEHNTIIFRIIDNGLGMKPELARSLCQFHELKDVAEGGSGIQNIVRRLDLYYGNRATIMIDTKINNGTQVVIRIKEDHTV